MEIFLNLIFLIYKKDRTKFSVEFCNDPYTVIGFNCPITEDDDFAAYCDFMENYGSSEENQHITPETEFFEIVYKTFPISVTPEGIKNV